MKIKPNSTEGEKCHCFTFLQISVLSGLIEDSWTLTSSTFDLLGQIIHVIQPLVNSTILVYT